MTTTTPATTQPAVVDLADGQYPTPRRSAWNKGLGTTGTCTIGGCGKPARNRGWCRMHYARWERHGDPHTVKPPHPSLPEVPGYRTMHKWVAKARGPANARPCAACGEQADHWSYDHQDPDEVVWVTEGSRWGQWDGWFLAPYSLDPEHYDPLCKSCHTKRDLAAARTRNW